MFHTRYSLFKQIYSHRASKAIEFMITDAFIEAGTVCVCPLMVVAQQLTMRHVDTCMADTAWNGRLSKAIDNPRKFAKLTDCVLRVRIAAATSVWVPRCVYATALAHPLVVARSPPGD